MRIRKVAKRITLQSRNVLSTIIKFCLTPIYIENQTLVRGLSFRQHKVKILTCFF